MPPACAILFAGDGKMLRDTIGDVLSVYFTENQLLCTRCKMPVITNSLSVEYCPSCGSRLNAHSFISYQDWLQKRRAELSALEG